MPLNPPTDSPHARKATFKARFTSPGPLCADGGVFYECPLPVPAPSWPFVVLPSDSPPSAGPAPAGASAQSLQSPETRQPNYFGRSMSDCWTVL